MTYEELRDLVGGTLVAGELIAYYDNKHISLGRFKDGVWHLSEEGEAFITSLGGEDPAPVEVLEAPPIEADPPVEPETVAEPTVGSDKAADAAAALANLLAK